MLTLTGHAQRLLLTGAAAIAVAAAPIAAAEPLVNNPTQTTCETTAASPTTGGQNVHCTSSPGNNEITATPNHLGAEAQGTNNLCLPEAGGMGVAQCPWTLETDSAG